MSTTTTTVPELTQEQVATILTQPLEEASQFLASGVQVFDTAGPLRVPGAPTFDLTDLAWTGESELIPDEDFDSSEVSLLPSTMKSIKVITRYSNELARQSVVSLDRVLQNRLIGDVAAKIDAQLFSAAGDGIAIPQGMFAWSGVQEVPALTGPLTLDDILDGQALALSGNVTGPLRLFLRPADYMALRGVKDGSQRYMLEPDATESAGLRILGLPVTVSSRIPAGRAAIADMSQVAVARDLSPSVKVLTERFADYDEQAIRVVARYDAKPLNPAAVVTFSGIV